jgi:large subunit ribosomal protein L5
MKLKERFEKEIKSDLVKELGLKNSLGCPTLKKIVINSGLGAALEDKKIIDYMVEDISGISGQKAVIARSKHDISNFGRLRKGDAIGVYVTLRGAKMWDFYDKLVNAVLPGVRDFRGLSKRSLDGAGNYSLGFKEHSIFFEVDQNRLEKARGLQVIISTTAKNNDEGYHLLKKLGMPFKD